MVEYNDEYDQDSRFFFDGTDVVQVRATAKLHEDVRFGSLMHEMTSEDTEGGEFSCIEYNSGSGLLSTAIAERYVKSVLYMLVVLVMYLPVPIII